MKIFRLLVWLVGIDIFLTIVCVSFFGAQELNPLAYNFTNFIILKLVVSIIGLIVLSRMVNLPGWKLCIGILVGAYGIVLLFNLTGIATTIV